MPINSPLHAFSADEIIREVEQQGGVYGLYLLSSKPIYFGSSDEKQRGIQGRLLRHANGDEGPCTQGAFLFNVEYCDNPVEREQELLDEYKAAYDGEFPQCNDIDAMA